MYNCKFINNKYVKNKIKRVKRIKKMKRVNFRKNLFDINNQKYYYFFRKKKIKQ